MSFPDELTAFRTYAKMYPDACILLVDTYDTLKSGVPHAIEVFKEMRDAGITSKLMGIRLDSGDIAYLSKKARKMLDDAGFTNAIISASSDLDEYLINSLKTQGCTVTRPLVVYTNLPLLKSLVTKNSPPRSRFPKIRKRSQTQATKQSIVFMIKKAVRLKLT